MEWQRLTTFSVGGTYTLTIVKDADSTAQLVLDDNTGFTVPAGSTSAAMPIHIEGGTHDLKIRYTDTGGVAQINFSAVLSQPDWFPVALSAAGLGVVSTTWQYPLPAYTEGMYAIEMRAGDAAGNVATEAVQPWQGEIDVAAPRVQLDVAYTGVGDTARTTYRVWAMDFNLSESGWASPCPIGLADRHYYSSAWWQQFAPGQDRLYQIYSECSVAGHVATLPVAQACDLYGHCAASNTAQTRWRMPNQKVLYTLEGNGQIVRLDLGTNLTSTVVTSGADRALTVHADGTLYYFDTLHQLWHVVPQSGASTAIYTDTDGGTGLAVYGTRLHWTVPTSGVRQVQDDGTGFAERSDTGLAGLDMNSFGRVYATGSTPGGLGKLTFFDGDDTSWLRTWTSTDPQISNGWRGTSVAFDAMQGQLYLAGQCGDPVGGPLGTARTVITGVQRLPAPTGRWDARTSVGCTPVIALSDPADVVLHVEVDQASQKLYYLVQDASTGSADLWRADLDGSSPEVIYTSTQSIHAFAVDDTNTLPMSYPTRAYTRADTPVSAQLWTIDVDGDLMTFSLLTPPTGGVLQGWPSGPSSQLTYVTYVPTSTFSGLDSFTYQADDGRGGRVTGVAEIDVRGIFKDSAILTPTANSAFALGQSVIITSALRADQGASQLQVLANGAIIPACTTSYSSPYPTSMLHTCTWTPTQPGRYDLAARVIDVDGPQTDLHLTPIYITHQPPAITTTTTVITAANAIYSNGRYALTFTGTATDSTSGHQVQAAFNGSAWNNAVSSGDVWTYTHYYYGSVLDGATYSLTAKVTDALNQSTISTTQVLLDFAPPGEVTLTPGAVGVGTLVVNQTVRTTHDLTLDWTAATDGSGVSGYFAGWTTSATPPADGSGLTWYATPTQHVQTVGEAAVYYAHVGSRDTWGNLRWQTFGPIFVDNPGTPDLYNLDTSTYGTCYRDAYAGWLDTAGTQVGADYALYRRTPAYESVQRLYTTWDVSGLALAWTGDDWTQGDNLFVYLDTAPGGATHAYNPWGSGPDVVLPSQGQPLGADDLIWLIDACTVRLYHWDGSAWQLTANANTSIDYPGFQVRTDWRVDRTIIRVPFAALNIVDPTNTALDMVAFATEPNTMKLWAAMPDQNPLNSTRANSGLAYRQTITTVTLTQQYHWPSLGSGVLPNANQFQDASVRVWLTPLPDSHSISYLDSGFFNLLTPGAFIDPDRDGTADPAFPFSTASAVGDGQVINYQVHYENLGPQTATGVNLRFTYGGALTGGPAALALGDLPGNSTGVVTITAAVNALLSPLSAELAAVIADDVHGDFDWAWVLHRVRSVPPTDVAITSLSTSANAGYIRSGVHTAAGTASDPYGVDQIELEITYPDASVSIINCPQADGSLTTWQCNWTAPENQLGVISARARAHNAIGLWSGWSSAFTITVDDTLPPLSLTVDPALLGTFQTQAIATPLIDLYGTGTNNLIAMQACLETAPSATCLRDNLAAAPISVTWGVSLTAPRADNAVITYNVSAQDAVWRTVDLSGTLRVDNVAPNVTTTCPFSQVALEDYWSGDPLLTPAPLALGIVSDGSGVITGSVRLSNSWDWNSYTPAEALNIVGGAWSYTPRFDTWGYHTLWVDLFDAAGNVAHTGCSIWVNLPTTDISLHATASPETLVNTGAVTYTATITNSGALTATGTTLEIYNHALTGTLTTSDGVSCTALASALRCSIGSLGPNATRTITVAGLMPATSPEARSFSALAYSAWQETNYANNWSFGAITVAHQADLQISQSGPTIVGSGQTVSYTLWITNAGPARVDASDGEQVSVADQLPIGFDFVAAAGEGWTCAYAGTVNCTRAGLDVGAAPPIVITLTRPLVTDSATARANTAYVAGSYDPVPGNNESSLALSVGDQAAVTVQMSSSATSLNLYDSITYLITATSAGPWPVMNATVIDALPAELMLLTYSAGCQPINATVECDLGNFQPGDTRHFTITAQYNAVNVYNTWLTNTATITAPYLYDLTTADNTATGSAWLYPSVDLWGTASVTPETAVVGRVVTYTAVIINDGPSAANFVTVTQALPPVVTYQSVAGDGWTCANVGNAVTCTRPALPAGQAATFTTTAQAVAWGWYESSRYDVASADFDRDMSDNPFFASLNVNSQYDLALTQTVSSEAVGLGDTLDYTLTVQNLGGLQVDGLTITNTLPAEVAFVSASGSWWMCSAAGQVVTCNYQITFHPGEASNVVVHTTLMSGSGLITNTATVGAPVEEDDLSNNTSVIAREINRPADLTVDLTADPAAISLNFNLYATITNHGPETADRSTTITLTGSGDLIWYEAVAALDWSCTGAQTATGPIVCVRTAPLAVGASSTITVNLNTNADYTANAVVTSRWPEPTPTDNAATLPVPMQATINLELNGSVEASGLTSCPTCIEPGGVLTYTAWVGNYGDGDATNVNLVSALPAGTTFGGFISSAGFDTCTAASDVVTCTLSTLVSYNDVDPQVVFTATAPLAFGPFTTTVTANADQFDPWPESNHGDLANEVAYSGGWGEAFADEAGICGHYQPCYTTLNTAHNHTDWSSRLTIYPGTFTETLLTLSQNIEVVFLGDVLLNGSLDLTNGTFRAPSGSFTLTGNFTTTGGAFEANGGTLIFGGLNQQLSLFEPTTFNNLTVMTGTTLIEVGMANHANPIGLLSNYGTIRRTQPVTGSGPIEFGLAGNVNGAQLLIDVATQDTLTSITIDRFDRDHPLATRMTGRYWTITPTGSGVVTLTLPHTLTTPFNARVCGYETNWDCRADSYTANTVTRGNITSFSDWAVGDNVTPTALGLVSLTATSTDKVWLLWVGVLSGLLLAGAFRLRRRRTQG